MYKYYVGNFTPAIAGSKGEICTYILSPTLMILRKSIKRL